MKKQRINHPNRNKSESESESETSMEWSSQKLQKIPIPGFDTNNEWNRLQRRINTQKHKVIKFEPGLETRNFKIAFAFVASLIFILMSIRHLSEHTIQHDTITQNTSIGQIETIQLSDGSKVTLNAVSSILFTLSDTARHVYLEGEAFFTVKHDKNSPFIVETREAKTRVLGTKFDVYSRDGETRTLVEDGRVRFQSILNDSDFVILTAKTMSQVTLETKPTKPSSIDPGSYCAWREGRLVFNNAPLIEVVGEMKRRYPVSIRLSSKEMESLPVTAVFEKATAENILRSISIALNIELVQEPDGYKFIYRPNDQTSNSGGRD